MMKKKEIMMKIILAQLVMHCTGIAKFIDSDPNFSGFIFTTG